MDFRLSDEHQAIQELARDFTLREIKPVVPDLEREGRFPREIIRRLGELGFLGACFPEEYGGSEMGFLGLVLAIEETTKYFPALGSAYNMCSMTCPYTILNWGNDVQRRKYAVPIIQGDRIGFFGLTEPSGGTDAFGAMRTRAARSSDGYVLNGSKMFITFVTEADWGLVFAKTDPDAGHAGVSAFLVETGWPGVRTQKLRTSLIGQCMATGELFLEDVHVPKENRLGEEGEGFSIAMNALGYGRLTVATRSVALAQGCLEVSLDYASQRHAFGKPIGDFQMIQRLITDTLVEVEAARLLVWRGAWLLDQGMVANRDNSVGKYFAAEVAARAARAAAEIFGGYAVTDEYPVARYLGMAQLMQTGEGSANLQRVLLAEDALGKKLLNRHNILPKFPIRKAAHE